jgi:hypothetical protein
MSNGRVSNKKSISRRVSIFVDETSTIIEILKRFGKTYSAKSG